MKHLEEFCGTYDREARQFQDHLVNLRRAVVQGNVQLNLDGEVLDDLGYRVQRFRRADCDARYRIAVAGAFGVGKSQLINAMLGRRVLPEELAHCTLVPTLVHKSRDGGSVVELRYLTAPEIAEILRDYQNRSTEEDWPTSVEEAAALSESRVAELAGSLKHHSRQSDVQSLLTAIRTKSLCKYVETAVRPERRRISADDIPDYVTRTSECVERYLVSSVMISMPEFPLGTDVELIDLPGTDADDPWARQVTLRYVRDVDAVLLVSDAEKIYQTSTAELLDRVKAWERLTDRLFLVINKSDYYGMHTPKDILGAVKMLRRGTSSYFGDLYDRLCFTSASAALDDDAKHDEAVEKLERIRTTGDLQLDELLGQVKRSGGLDHLINRLRDFLANSAIHVKMQSIHERWTGMLDEVGDVLVPAAREAQTWLARTSERRSEHYRSVVEGAARNIETAAERLRSAAAELAEDLGAGTTGELRQRLSSVGRESLSCEVADLDERQDASVAAHRLWVDVHGRLRTGVLQSVGDCVLEPFLNRCRDEFGADLELLRSIQVRPKVEADPPRHPADLLRLTLEARVAELWGTATKIRPYQQPGNRVFSAFREVFEEDVERWYNRRVTDLLRFLPDIVLFYLGWHIDMIVAETRGFVGALQDANAFYQFPECFSPVDPQEKDEAERCELTATLGEEFSRIRREPADRSDVTGGEGEQ